MGKNLCQVNGAWRAVPEFWILVPPIVRTDLLQQAGMTLPVQLDFWYPTGVSRPYMPDPQRNFEAFSASLEKSGCKIVPHSAPWRPDDVTNVNSGNAGNINLIAWTGDYGDPDNFLCVFFKNFNPQFGFQTADLTALLNQAAATPDHLAALWARPPTRPLDALSFSGGP